MSDSGIVKCGPHHACNCTLQKIARTEQRIAALEAENAKLKGDLSQMYAHHPEADCYDTYPKLRQQLTEARRLLEEVALQIRLGGAIDNHGQRLENLSVLRAVRERN